MDRILTHRPNRTLVDLRVKKGWTQPRLAHEAGVAIGTVNQAETGARVPIALTQEKIATALGVAREDIWPEADLAQEEAS